LALIEILLKNKKDILKDLFDAIIFFYPKEAVKFLTHEKDRFLNPVGITISESIEIIFDFIMDKKDKDVAIGALESIIRIMAVYDLKPSEAISWVFQLKDVLKKHLKKDDSFSPELDPVFHRIDDLMLSGFDLYMKCKEDINRIRIKEQMVKNMGVDFFKREAG